MSARQNVPLAGVWLVGSYFLQSNDIAELSSLIQLPIKHVSPFAFLNRDSINNQTKLLADASFAVACGAAINGFEWLVGDRCVSN